MNQEELKLSVKLEAQMTIMKVFLYIMRVCFNKLN